VVVVSFNQDDLKHIGYADGFSLWQYETSDDSLTVMGAGYFNDVEPIQIFGVNDRIFCTTSDATLTLAILANDGSSVTIQDTTVSHQSLFSDYLVPGFTVRVGASAPDLAELRDGLFLLAFNGVNTPEQGFFSIHILHDIKFGTTPTFHVHWTHNQSSPSGNVKWNIDYSVARGYGVGTYGAPTTLSTIQAAPSQYVHQLTDDDDMPLASIAEIEPDSQIIGRIYRDPADSDDTFADDAFLIGVDLHYVKAQIGTLERNRPFISGGWSL
jgi:hypothetical protein